MEIDLPETIEADVVARGVEDVCGDALLDATLKTTLKKYPGCTHWHFKKPNEKGILEVTLWPQGPSAGAARLWLSVHGNRSAEWIEQLMPQLKEAIEKRLKS